MDCRLGYELLLLGLHCQGRWQLWICGCMDVGSNLPLFTGFLTKERDSGFYWSMVETKEVYFKKTPTNLRHVWIRHFIETYRSASPLQHHQFVKCSNIRGPITDLTRQTYGDVWFDKFTI